MITHVIGQIDKLNIKDSEGDMGLKSLFYTTSTITINYTYYNLIYSSTVMVALIYFPSTNSTSIIDRQGLNFCVRNGNRYFPKPHQHHR